MSNNALVLTGGGARAAYQAGAIRALAELWPEKSSPFNIITGISAGSVNACLLAHYADDFKTGGMKLWDLWHDLTVEKVINTDAMTLSQLALTVLRDLVLGGFIKSPASSHLLDTSPLRKIITDNVDFGRVHAHVESGLLHGFAVTATNYHNGCAVTFFDSVGRTQEWGRGNHMSAEGPLNDSHIMASSAIPVFFPPIEIGGRYYGDGSVRLLSPLSPSVHLGAEKILAIGIRHSKDPEQYRELENRPRLDISFADIAGVFLNAVFLDALESDIQRMLRINNTLQQFAPDLLAQMPGAMRIIPTQAIRPSRDLGQIAAGGIERFPFLLKHLLRGIGARRKRGNEVLSYLAFDKTYCGKLLRLGYKDAMKRRDELLKFMKEAQ
jgi:NTE family protein